MAIHTVLVVSPVILLANSVHITYDVVCALVRNISVGRYQTQRQAAQKSLVDGTLFQVFLWYGCWPPAAVHAGMCVCARTCVRLGSCFCPPTWAKPNSGMVGARLGTILAGVEAMKTIPMGRSTP